MLDFTVLYFCTLVSFLSPSYERPVISKDNLGKVTANCLSFKLGCWSSLVRNFSLGAYANGTRIDCTTLPFESFLLICILLNI